MMMQWCVSLCLLLLLGWMSQTSEGKTLLLDKCVVNVHMHELHMSYSTIRTSAISGDTAIEVKLLDKSLLKKVPEGQVCCFLRLLLRFYVTRVFGNYVSSLPEEQRCSSALANAFISIRKDIHKCHCHCEEETQRIVDSVSTEFDKLQIPQAAKKAVGELATVLEWLGGLSVQAPSKK